MNYAYARRAFLCLSLLAAPIAQAQTNTQISVTDQQISRLGIQTDKALETKRNVVAELPARIMPAGTDQQTITAPFEGTVSDVNVLAGQSVRRGDVLFSIASRDFIAEQSGLEQAAAELETAKAASARQRRLVDEGIAAGSSLEAAMARERVALAMVREHQRSAAQGAQAGRKGTYFVKARSDGEIETVHARIGDTVPAMSSLAIVSTSNKLWAQVQIPVSLIGQLDASDAIRFPGGEVGSIISMQNKIDPATRSGLLIASVPSTEKLFSGQLVSVQLLRSVESQTLISVPASSVIEIDGVNRVFQRKADGFEMIDVHVEGAASGVKILRTSLVPGDEVAIRGLVELKAIALEGLN